MGISCYIKCSEVLICVKGNVAELKLGSWAKCVSWSTIAEDLWFDLVAFVKEVKGRSIRMNRKVMGTARVH